jgi:quinol monooxygenase YgiN
MSITVILELKSAAGGVEKLLSYLEEVLPDTRKYTGYEDLRVTRDVNDDALVICIEKWQSAAAYQRYLGWRMETGVMARLASMLEGTARPVLLSEISD